ncbi:hypothetical protein J7M00_06950 [bacterium]|nr:hypothetical protein [bacterium]
MFCLFSLPGSYITFLEIYSLMSSRCMKIIVFLLFILTFAGASPVEVEFFYSKYCEHCQTIMNDFLPQYMEQYKGKVKFVFYEVEDNLDNYEKLLAREAKAGDTDNELPVIFIGNSVLGGDEEIHKYFLKELKKALSGEKLAQAIKPKDTTKTIVVETTVVSQKETTSVPAESISAAVQGTVYAMFFLKKGCSHCDRINHDLKLLERNAPENFGVVFVYKTYDIADPKSKLMHEVLCELNNVDYVYRMATPAVFFDGVAQIYGYTELNYFSLVEALKKFPDGSRKLWDTITDEELADAENRIATRFSKFNIAPIIFAGLLDGINPCAFGALIFFITFLTIAERKRGEILLVGIAYTIAVFLTYYSVGAGFLGFLASLPIFQVIARWVYIFTGVLAVGLGIFSIVDFVKAKRGKLKDMTLQLPDKLKKKIHRIIITENEPRTKRNFILAAFITGFFVSLLELACTGQVYLPTIIYVLGIPGLRMKAHLYLLLYNFMFIVPLLFIFMITYFGTTSEQLNLFLKRHTAMIKLLTAAMFFGMAALLWRSILVG